MMKGVISILMVLLSSFALVSAEPLTLPYDIQGAKIVSEGAYFWLEITSNVGPSGGRGAGSEIFIGFPPDFPLHAVCINNQEITVTISSVNATLQMAVYLEPLDKVEVLLSAPYLAENETVRHVVININIISPLGGTQYMSNFHMSVVGLTFLPAPDALETEYTRLLNESAKLNKTTNDLQLQIESMNNQLTNLTADRDALKETAASLRTEVMNLNSQITNETYALVILSSVATLAIVACAYLAFRQKTRQD